MSESVNQENIEQFGLNDQPQPAINQFENIGLNEDKMAALLIDNREVYYRGFLSLTEEQKAKVLLGFLILNNGIPDINNLVPETTDKVKAKHELWKDKELFSIKKWGSIGFLTLAIIGIIAFLGVFIYITLKQGVLDDNGILSGLLTSVQEVLRILFTSPADI